MTAVCPRYDDPDSDVVALRGRRGRRRPFFGAVVFFDAVLFAAVVLFDAVVRLARVGVARDAPTVPRRRPGLARRAPAVSSAM